MNKKQFSKICVGDVIRFKVKDTFIWPGGYMLKRNCLRKAIVQSIPNGECLIDLSGNCNIMTVKPCEIISVSNKW